MATTLLWTCDGCGEKVDMTPSSSKGSDWKRVTVALSGFKGYPVGDHANGSHDYELCPNCQRHLADQANPRMWPRVKAEAQGTQS